MATSDLAREAEIVRAKTESGRSVGFSAFHFLPPKFPLAENDVVSARWGTKWRAETFPRRTCPLLNFPHTKRKNPILRAEMVQVTEVALFLRGDFPVWFAPICQCCGFISSIHPRLQLDEAFLPELLIISLFLLPLIIFDKYWSKVAMARRGPNKWNKEDSAMLTDTVQKNPVFWHDRRFACKLQYDSINLLRRSFKNLNFRSNLVRLSILQ